ncbi:MAG: hypothetical protein HOP11_11855 [Saprospiraceae bacterium]|nr:hypothetical protein [Saprospiraceae bacterium]
MNGTFVEYLDTVLVDSTQSIYNHLKSRTEDPKCPKWGRSWWDETFGSGGTFWSSIGNFFKSVFGGSGGSNGNGNGKNGYGGQFFGSGGGYSGGSDGGGYGTGGGGPNNNGEPKFRDIFSEYQLKLFTKAIKKLNDYFDSEEEMAYWLLILGPDCLEKIANLPPVSIDGLEELECLQEFLRFKASGLTDEECEDYKEDKECKNSAENKAKVEKFKSDISKAIENELKQLALDLPGVPFDADLLKSIMSKVILKKTGKLIPLVGVGLDIVELKAAYAAGDYVAMGLSIGSILTEVIPCAMIIDLGLDAASIGNTIFKAYKSLSELKTYLGSNSHVFKAISETIDDLDLTDALDWSKNKGALDGQFKVLFGNKSFEEFCSKLAAKLGASWIPPSGFPRTMSIPGISFALYIDSSYGAPTIQIDISGVKFKIRLQ